MHYRTQDKPPPGIRQATCLFLLILPVFLTGSAAAQSGGPYDLSWSTLDSGGLTFSTGGSFALGGTIGQPDAGSLSSGAYAIEGGFWLGGSMETSAVDPPPPEAAPLTLKLLGHSPNPFHRSTTIGYELPVDGTHVQIRVFDPSGREIAVLADGIRSAGRHTAVWSGTDRWGTPVASGVYFYRFDAGSETHVRKMVLIE